QDFVPPKATPQDAEELARELVRHKKLTKFQAEEIYNGNAKSLFLANYVLLEKIGQGGMGVVYKAEHRRMKRAVAIKMLPPERTKDSAAARFAREVEAAAKLRHPNIVAADDADEANGVHFLVMEFVEGSNLSALVKKHGPLSVAQAINCIAQAARGLEFAHKKGVVHRDIKPANLLLDTEGTVKILDMGLARISTAADAATQAELTGTGSVMGTVDYMAPEQALSTKDADARADIYSLGCSLFYLLTGGPTYAGETATAKLLAHQTHPIPTLRSFRADVPEQVEAVFRKMVAKNVEDRYQTITSVIADLQKCCSEQSVNMQLAFDSTATSLSVFLKDSFLSAATTRMAAKPIAATSGRHGKRGLLLRAAGVAAALLLGVVIYQIQSNRRDTADDQTRKGPQVAIASHGAADAAAQSAADDQAVEPAPLKEPPPAVAPFDARQAQAHQTAWARYLKIAVEHENSLGMKLVLIPPGEFTMGSPQAEVDALMLITDNKPWQD
ncbi:MAG TPA: protein kinase, partial [Pirellulales bacterium]